MKEVVVEIIPDRKTTIYAHTDINNYFIANAEFSKLLGVTPQYLRALKSDNDLLLEEGDHYEMLRVPTQGGMQMTTAWSRQGMIVVCNLLSSDVSLKALKWAENYNSGKLLRSDADKLEMMKVLTDMMSVVFDDDNMNLDTKQALVHQIKQLKLLV